MKETKAANENKCELETLKLKVEEQRKALSELFDFTNVTENIGENPWGDINSVPKKGHPRVLITKDHLPNIRKKLKEANQTNEFFLSLVDAEIDNDCILPPPTVYDTNVITGNGNIYNWSLKELIIIQAKALSYLIYEDEKYAYQAILYIKNYLKTLDIVSMGHDQYYEYCLVMFTAGLVYDWCYDILTEEDKVQIIAGVENRICRMENKAGPAVHEGFPPSEGSAISGTATTTEILRDFLAFSIAIYDENTSWWDYVAARVINDLIPFRNYYYQSGIIYHGTMYCKNKNIPDMYSDWLLKIATGVSHYDDGIKSAIKGMFGYECDNNGHIFEDGDNHLMGLPHYQIPATMAAYLYDDATLMAISNWLTKDNPFRNNDYLSAPLYVALRGLASVEPSAAADRHDGLPLIQYNGYPMGQYFTHGSWSGNDSPAVKMRIRERHMSGHEHYDAGSFEIYYKGMLTNTGGRYSGYGFPHTRMYSTLTISKNSIVVVDPARVVHPSQLDITREDWEHIWHSGSQRYVGTPPTFDRILADKYTFGVVTGRQHAYLDKEETKPHYAYVAGDITRAYESNTINYVGRRMLTVYTGNKDFPMALFVYDDVDSKNDAAEKKCLLQISSPDAPAISRDEKTIITENGEGRLVLKSLSDDVMLRAIGGRIYDENGKYNPKLSSNYVINGMQCYPDVEDRLDDGHWGRVEIIAAGVKNQATFMNVLYVTDKGQTKTAPEVTKISCDGVNGGTFGNIVAAFATSRTRVEDKLSFTVSGDGEMSYFVSGVSAGKWEIMVDDKPCGVAMATEDSGLLTFTAPAGKVSINSAK